MNSTNLVARLAAGAAPARSAVGHDPSRALGALSRSLDLNPAHLMQSKLDAMHKQIEILLAKDQQVRYFHHCCVITAT